MGILENLPRIGTSEAVTQFLDAYKGKQIPRRFSEFLLGHLDAAHGFKSDAEVSQVVGSFLLVAGSKGEVRQALELIEQAFTKSLTPEVARHYQMLKTGFGNVITMSKLPD